MAPRDLPKRTKTSMTSTEKKPATNKPSVAAKTQPQAAITAPSLVKKVVAKTPLKAKSTRTAELRQRTNTSKLKETKSAPPPGSAVKSAKKSWQRRPKPAHSGVPMPEKMQKLLQKHLQNPEYSFTI